ncbi:MAG: nucleotide exchange factor GrpE [Pseudomonadota bacterium]|nr:nucleotide exchange factor GrpE [Pseudomonadota bacterium]
MRLDPAQKDSLIEEFRAYLDEWVESDVEESDTAVDLHTLLAEMAALKNEIRLESRQFKAMLEEMRQFGEVLREQNERLNRELERAREQAATGKRQAERGLLLGLLDLRDRLAAGVDAGAAHRPAFLARLVPAETRFADSLAQGLALTLRRVDELLDGHQVRPLEAIGQSLDPHRMRAVGVAAVPGQPDGQVLREVLRGYYQHGELLRAAEVIVNKKA